MATVLRSTAPLLDLVGEIYDCVIEPGHWPFVLERIARMIDGDNAAISLAHTGTNRISVRAQWNVAPKFEEDMLANFAINPLVPAVWFNDVDSPYTASQTLGKEELKFAQWHRRAVAPHGYGDAIATLLAKSSSHFGSLSLFRDGDKPSFGADEVTTLRRLAPHVRRAVMISDMLDARRLERDRLAATLDRLSVGVILADGDGQIAHANAAMHEHMLQGSALRRIGGLLTARDPASARDLAQAIADAASGTTVDIPSSGIVVFLKGSAGHDFAAWILPLDGGLRREFAASLQARVAIFVRQIGANPPFPAELFVRRYAITPAECRVMMLLVQGMSIAEAAETLGIALPTAKTHLAHLFEKTGTSRQTDLVRLVMSALAPVG